MSLCLIILKFIIGIALIFASKDEEDLNWHCRKYDFETLNMTVDGKIVVVYNSALCKLCLKKLLIFKSLKSRFELAEYADLIFIMLTTEHVGSPKFKELLEKAGNITIISLHDIHNDFFVSGSFYTFDKCSRLTYELVPPLNEKNNQIVKASILSTWYDSPCGCEFEEKTEKSLIDFNETMLQSINFQANWSKEIDINVIENNVSNDYVDESDNVQDTDSSFLIPLKVIVPVEHIHKITNFTYIKYNFMVLNLNDSTMHEHLSNDKTEILLKSNIIAKMENTSSSILMNNSNTDLETNILLTNEEGNYYTVKQKYLVNISNEETMDQIEEVKIKEDFEVITETPANVIYSNDKKNASSLMFIQLRPWLSYRLSNRT